MWPVLLAGSLGQHTAVPGNYDVDLVIYSDSKLYMYHTKYIYIYINIIEAGL